MRHNDLPAVIATISALHFLAPAALGQSTEAASALIEESAQDPIGIEPSLSDALDSTLDSSLAIPTDTQQADTQQADTQQDVSPVIEQEPLARLRNDGAAWRIYKTEWDGTDEKGFERFVRAIGWSDCTSLETCLNNPANPFRATDKRFYSGDCADMAYTLRAYFAWKNGLPFSYQSAMRTADGKPEDPRYSTGGNVVAGRRSTAASSPISAPSFIARIPGEVSTAMFRTHPETGGGRTFDDFYPVEVSRDAIRPGVVAYDIYGHVGIVYDVLEDGRALIIASHPDHSVTRSVYGPNFMRSKPELGSGFKAWRPLKLVGAKQASDGSFRGGRIKGLENSLLSDYSVEQYFGNEPHPSGEWSLGSFRIGQQTLPYYDFVRRRLAAPGYKFNPVTEFRNGLEAICAATRDRKYAVDAARMARIHLRPHPKRLPANIYGTYGDWEAYSTPSRDARLKVLIIELRREIQRLISDLGNPDGVSQYGGDSLGDDLWITLMEEVEDCQFTYWRSDNTRIRLNLSHVIDRIWDLSFDPYHCPERRWGANGSELLPCTDGAQKTAWYNAQRFLRYQAERTYDVRMDFSLEELKPPSVASPEEGGIGVEAPADADLLAFVSGLRRTQGSADLALISGDGTLLVAGEQEAPEIRFPEWHYKIKNNF